MRVFAVPAIAALLLTGCNAPSESEVANADAGNQAKPKAASTAPSALPTDAQGFVSALAAGDAYEIESSRLALQRSTSPGVNEMAQMLQREHLLSSAKLKAVAAGAGLKVPTTLDAEKQNLIDDLKAAQGPAFDQAFLGQQRMAHVKTLMIIQNYQAAGDNAALKQLAASLQPRIEFHIDRLNATLK
jgi:putative membrane protein